MLLDLPDFRQKDDHSCGVIAAKIALNYVGRRVAQTGLSSRLLTTPWDGTDPRALEGVLRQVGCAVLAGEMDVDDLREQTRRYRPVIALVTMQGCGHYVVVAGVERGRVHFQDPLEGRVILSAAEFGDAWRDFGRHGESFRNYGLAIWR